MIKTFVTLIRGRMAEVEQAAADAHALPILDQQIRDAVVALGSARRALAIASAQSETEVRESDAIGLSQLGLLRPREAGKRVGELSMGQQRRLDLALVLAMRPHVLLLDEPTNHLSIALVDELTDALGATTAAVVLSTHEGEALV